MAISDFWCWTEIVKGRILGEVHGLRMPLLYVSPSVQIEDSQAKRWEVRRACFHLACNTLLIGGNYYVVVLQLQFYTKALG